MTHQATIDCEEAIPHARKLSYGWPANERFFCVYHKRGLPFSTIAHFGEGNSGWN